MKAIILTDIEKTFFNAAIDITGFIDNEIEEKAMTAIMLHPDDNVATVIQEIGDGEEVQIISDRGKIVKAVTAADSIPQNHKIALQTVKKDADVIKLGEVIGRATQLIRAGDHVHIHNVVSKRVR